MTDEAGTRLQFREDRSASGSFILIAVGECEWDDFPSRAQHVADQFSMAVVEKVDGLDVRMWIARLHGSVFCISWDIWIPEVSVMAWKGTSEAAVERLVRLT